jgi:hypothetical protein
MSLGTKELISVDSSELAVAETARKKLDCAKKTSRVI